MKKTLFAVLMIIAGIAHAEDFSVKGIKFGMAKQEIKDLGDSTNNFSYTFFGNAVNMKSLLGTSGNGFIQMNLYYDKDADILTRMWVDAGSDTVSIMANSLLEKFGQPDVVDATPWQNRMGAMFPNKVLIWKNANGAYIRVVLRDSTRDMGYVLFTETGKSALPGQANRPAGKNDI